MGKFPEVEPLFLKKSPKNDKQIDFFVKQFQFHITVKYVTFMRKNRL
jgi:hypothetical protein